MYTLIARLADHDVHDEEEEDGDENDDDDDEYEDEDDDRFCQKGCSVECGYCILEHMFHFDVFAPGIVLGSNGMQDLKPGANYTFYHPPLDFRTTFMEQ